MNTQNSAQQNAIPYYPALFKRGFDIILSFTGLLASWWIIALAIIAARYDTDMSGLFRQDRVGMFGREFEIYKIRTMRNLVHVNTTITQRNDPRITKLGQFMRRFKIDELPQLWNVLKGDMSFVGPRPDVPGYADQLEGDARILLRVRPGITGPATLRYRNEEEILANVDDPEKYNNEVIYPDKIRLNIEYIKNYNFKTDLICIAKTIFG